MDSVMVNLTYPNAVDIDATQFALPGNGWNAGQVGSATLVLRNFGANDSGFGTSALVYMSSDPVVDELDTLVGQQVLGSIPGGWSQGTPYLIQVLIPSETTGTKYFAARTVGPYADLVPGNDWSPVISKEFKPDLRFAGAHVEWLTPATDVQGTVKAVPGEQLIVRLRYENVGNAATADTTRVQMFSASLSTGAGTPLGYASISQPVVPPNSGTLVSESLNFDFPTIAEHWLGGSRWIYFRFTDAGDESGPTNNNESSRTLVKPVARVDLVLGSPTVLGPSVDLADNDPAITWVNLDNDDKDSHYDNDPSLPGGGGSEDGVAGGDDELVRVQIRIKPSNIALYTQGNAKVRVRTVANADCVKLWNTNEKPPGSEVPAAGEFLVAAPGSSFSVAGDWLVRNLWLEGVRGPSPQEGLVELELEILGGLNVGAPDIEQVQVLDVTAVVFYGRDNGFTQDSTYHDAVDNLANDPNHAAVGVPSVRFCPDARKWNPGQPLKYVWVEYILNQAPLRPTPIYLRSFDVDDPAADSMIDPNDAPAAGRYFATGGPSLMTYDKDEDNRNSADDATLPKAGRLWRQLTASPSGPQDPVTKVLTVVVQPGFQYGHVALEVSMSPGDNYRVAGSGDVDFLLDARNLDKEDGLRITNKYVLGTLDTRALRAESRTTTLVGVVWRILHLEGDRMLPMAPHDNKVNVRVSSVELLGSSVLELRTVDPIDLPTNWTLDTAPPNVNNGRFEGGRCNVRGGPSSIPIVANGVQRLRVGGSFGDDVVPVSGVLKLTPLGVAPEFPVRLTAITKISTTGPERWRISLDPSQLPTNFPDPWTQLVGQSFVSIGEGENAAVVESNQSALTLTVDRLDFWVELLDDDERSAFAPTNLTPLRLESLNAALTPAYIHGQFDGGVEPNNNDTGYPFRENHAANELEILAINDGSVGTTEAHDTRAYWCVYVGAGFQQSATLARDPNWWPPPPPNQSAITYDPTLGQTSGAVWSVGGTIARGGWSSWVYHEVIRDSVGSSSTPAFINRVGLTLAHEIGHQLGLPHWDEDGVEYPEGTNLMSRSNGAEYITAFHCHLLRCRRTTATR